MLELGYSRTPPGTADLLATIPQLARELATWTRHKRRERQLQRDQPEVEFFVGNSLTAKVLQQLRGRGHT